MGRSVDLKKAIEDREKIRTQFDAIWNYAWNQAIEKAAQAIEVASLDPKLDDNFNQSKAGCAAILADEIRKLQK